MARNLDTALVRAFVAVAETGGMTRAGERLNLTQAAVSQQIKRLEDSFGRPLFARDRRGLTLTPDGERLLPRAVRLLALSDEIWSEMTGEPYGGEVRLGIPYDIVNTYLPPILRQFSRACPRVRITLDCRPSPLLRDALDRGDLDIAVTTEATCGPGGETLLFDRLVWVGARGGEAHRQRPLPVSLGSDTCAFRNAIHAVLRGADIEWRTVSEINNLDAMNATVQTDLAVTGLLASTLPPGLELIGPDKGLPPLPMFSINLYVATARKSVAVLELARYLREGIAGRRSAAA